MTITDPPALPDAPRILITRLSAIGDCIHTVPLLAALRRHWPQAQLGWVTRGGPASLLQNHPQLDQLIVVPPQWHRGWNNLVQLRSRLQATRWDVVIDPQSLAKSALLGWLSGCTQRIGFARPQGRELSPWLNNHLIVPRHRHVVDRYLELLAPLGILHPPVTFNLGPYPAAAEQVTQQLRKLQLARRQFLVINPGAGWPSKVWPASRYGSVAHQLSLQHNLPSVVVWSGAAELDAARQIVNTSRGAALMGPATTLPELAEWCRAARLFIGSDTGPMHLAAAVGTPCVALYGPTDPRVCGPYGSTHRTVQTLFQRPRRKLAQENSAMSAIRVQQVTAAASQLLDQLHLRDLAA